MSSLRGIRGVLNPLTYPLSHQVLVQTKRAVELMRHRYHFCGFEVLPNPIAIPDQVTPIEERPLRIINIGSLEANKNQKGLIRIFSGLSSGTGWILDFVGDGRDRESLKTLVNASGLEDSVSLLGQRNDVGALLQDSRIFAFTSLTEGFPNALAEAMAAGCACISYDCPTGPSELIEHGVNGFLVEPGDEAEYARLLQMMIDDAELRARFSRNARESMKRFEAGAVMARLEKMVEEIVGRDPAKGSKGKRAKGA